MSLKPKGLNIKNKDTHQLAAKLAKMTGESMTEAVTQSLRERLQRLQSQHKSGLAERLLQIGDDCAAQLGNANQSEDPTAFLYDDETGLPK